MRRHTRELSSRMRFANAQANCRRVARVATPVRNEGLPGADAFRHATLPAANVTIRDGDARRSCGPVGPIRRMDESAATVPVPIMKTMGGPMSLKK